MVHELEFVDLIEAVMVIFNVYQKVLIRIFSILQEISIHDHG